MSIHPTEDQEWVAQRIESWVETYKKSMLMPVVLELVAARQCMSIADIAKGIRSRTDWDITERGLYRTLRRLENDGLLISTNVDAPRTGAKRKEISLTPTGMDLLDGIRKNLIDLEWR